MHTHPSIPALACPPAVHVLLASCLLCGSAACGSEAAQTHAAEESGAYWATNDVPRDDSIDDDFVLIPPGTFLMGGSRQHPLWLFNVSPLHPVTITRPLAVQPTPVTQGEFARVTGQRPSFFEACGDDCPVERVSFYDAVAYANLRSAQAGLERCYETEACEGEPFTGCGDALECRDEYRCARVHFVGLDCTGYRLPTEAEQELLIRAGTRTPWPIDGLVTDARLSEFAVWYGNSANSTYNRGHLCFGPDADDDGEPDSQFPCAPLPVASRAPNAFGLYDTIGLVYTWGFDGYSPGYPTAAWQVDPIDLRSTSRRVVRGGSFLSPRDQLLSFTRGRVEAHERSHVVSVRLVRTAGPAVAPAVCEGDLFPPDRCILAADLSSPNESIAAACDALGAVPLHIDEDLLNEWTALRFATDAAPVLLDVRIRADGRATDARDRPVRYQRWGPGETPSPGASVRIDAEGYWRVVATGGPARTPCERPSTPNGPRVEDER